MTDQGRPTRSASTYLTKHLYLVLGRVTDYGEVRLIVLAWSPTSARQAASDYYAEHRLHFEVAGSTVTRHTHDVYEV